MNIVVGASAMFQGVALLRREPRLLPLVIAPMALALVVYFAVIVGGYFWFAGWVESLAISSVSWWSWLGTIGVVAAKIAFIVLALGVVLFTFVTLATVLSALFGDPISLRVERALRGSVPEDRGGIGAFAGDFARGVGHAVKRQLRYVGTLALGLPLLLIPVAGSMLFFAVFALASIRLLALDSIDPYLSRRRLTGVERAAYARDHRAALLGLGGCSFLLLFVPLVGALVPSLCVIGGTVLCVELEKPK